MIIQLVYQNGLILQAPKPDDFDIRTKLLNHRNAIFIYRDIYMINGVHNLIYDEAHQPVYVADLPWTTKK